MNMLTESLWGDEAFSALAVMKSFGDMIGVVMRDTAPPLFYILGWVWGNVLGFSEVALRSLSLLLILGASFFGGLIVYEIDKRKKVAVLVFLLAFLTPFLNRFAFEWRMYALLAFTTAGSCYFFVARKWWGYVVMTVAMLYTHHFGLFTLAAQGLWFVGEILTKSHLNRSKWIFSTLLRFWPFGVIFAAYAPWIYPMYLQTTRVQGAGFWLSKPTITEGLDLIYRFFVGGVEDERRFIVAIMVGLLLVFKLWSKKFVTKWLEVAVIFFAPVVIAFGVSYAVTPVFYDRYLLSVLVGVAVLVGVGIRKWMMPVLTVLILIYGIGSYNQFSNPNKRPFRDFAALVKSQMKQGDVLININGRAHHIWETKYYGIGAPIYTPDGPLPLYVGTAQMAENDTVDKLPEVAGRIGTITSEDDFVLPGYIKIDEARLDSLKIIWWTDSHD